MKRLFVILATQIVLICVSYAQTFDMQKWAERASAGKVEASYKELLKHLSSQDFDAKLKSEKNTKAQSQLKADLHLQYLALGQWAMQLKKWSEAREHLTKALNYGSTNQSHIQYLIGHAFKEEGLHAKAMDTFNRVFALSPAQNISYDTRKELSDIAVQMGQLRKAREHLQKLERRWRNTSNHPEILWQLTDVEMKDNRRHIACKWARKLYTKYPAHPLVSSWGVDLHDSKMGEKTVGCHASLSDTKSRIRNLRLNGMADRARKEIDLIKSRARNGERVQADMLLAEHLENQGYPDEGLKVLVPYYESHKHDLNFLSLFGKLAARSGEYQVAIGAYSNVHKASPRSRMGRNALFTAAYLSYQIQDYDGAFRRFTSINEKFQGTSLARDARWHLAWLHYLKGNYATAEKAYKSLAAEKIYKRRRRVVRPFQDDRTKYWLAMSMFKQDKMRESGLIFNQLAKDKSMSYYSILAQMRLKQIAAEPRILASSVKKPKEEPSALTKEELQAINKESENGPLIFSAQGEVEKIKEDSEENLKLSDVDEPTVADEDKPLTGPDSTGSLESKDDVEPETSDSEVVGSTDGEGDEDTAQADATDEQDQETAYKGPKIEAADGESPEPTEAETVTDEESETIVVTTFSDPRLQARFEAASNLIALGLNDWAKWELYEIERRTKNKTYLKKLMEMYTKIGYYHRSHYISEIYFGSERQKLGLQNGREFWSYNFPKAYSKVLESYANQFNVAPTLVLAIMRAESQFNKDAMSPVGARGLMQIMPYTATHLARLIGDDFGDDNSLFRPEISIKMGARYLSRLQKKFQDQVPLVAAAYNAGPHRVFSWLNTFGNLDMDEFIEHVPFVETRNYMKKVVRNYAVYNALYDNKPVTEYAWLTEPVPVKVAGRPSPRENWDTTD